MKSALSLVGSLHSRWVLQRRFQVLANTLAALVPAGASVLDIGCGDGTIGFLLQRDRPDISIQGLEVAARPSCRIACTTFDGMHLPYGDGSYDLCLFVDVLHHTPQIDLLLREACRVSRKFILIKDHVCQNGLDLATLKFMDWVGNRPHGVVLPYNYQSQRQWAGYFGSSGLQVLTWEGVLPIYPFPWNSIFGRGLHFAALLSKPADSVPEHLPNTQEVRAHSS